MSVEQYSEEVRVLRALVKEHSARLQAAELSLAIASCPYKAGQTLKSSNGLGQAGFVVSTIYAPKYPSEKNRWEVCGFVIKKDGTLSQRTYSIEERYVGADPWSTQLEVIS